MSRRSRLLVELVVDGTPVAGLVAVFVEQQSGRLGVAGWMRLRLEQRRSGLAASSAM